MPLRPDIVVTRPDSPEVLLVVSVQRTASKTASEAALKNYLVQMSCPSGMLVTPDSIRFYRNLYTGYSPQAVELIAECLTGELLGTPATGLRTEQDLETRVQEWLESLAAGASLGDAAREAIESCVLPAVSTGIVRAGGPRWRRTA